MNIYCATGMLTGNRRKAVTVFNGYALCVTCADAAIIAFQQEMMNETVPQN